MGCFTGRYSQEKGCGLQNVSLGLGRGNKRDDMSGGLREPLLGPGTWVRWEWGAVIECGGKMRLQEEEKPQLLCTRNFESPWLQGQQGPSSRGRTQLRPAWGAWGAELPPSVDNTLGPRAGEDGRRCWCFHPSLAPHQPSADSLLCRGARSNPATAFSSRSTLSRAM